MNLYKLKSDIDYDLFEKKLTKNQKENIKSIESKIETINFLNENMQYTSDHSTKYKIVKEIRMRITIDMAIENFNKYYEKKKRKDILINFIDEPVIKEVFVIEFFEEVAENDETIINKEILDLESIKESPTFVADILNFTSGTGSNDFIEVVYLLELCWALRNDKIIYAEKIDPFKTLYEGIKSYNMIKSEDKKLINTYVWKKNFNSLEEFANFIKNNMSFVDIEQIKTYYSFDFNSIYRYDRVSEKYVNKKGQKKLKAEFEDQRNLMDIGNYIIEIKALYKEVFQLSFEQAKDLFVNPADFILLSYMLLADISKEELFHIIDRQVIGYKYIKSNYPEPKYAKYKILIFDQEETD